MQMSPGGGGGGAPTCIMGHLSAFDVNRWPALLAVYTQYALCQFTEFSLFSCSHTSKHFHYVVVSLAAIGNSNTELYIYRQHLFLGFANIDSLHDVHVLVFRFQCY